MLDFNKVSVDEVTKFADLLFSADPDKLDKLDSAKMTLMKAEMDYVMAKNHYIVAALNLIRDALDEFGSPDESDESDE